MDAKRGSPEYKRLAAVQMPGAIYSRTVSGLWVCEIPGSRITAGVGASKTDAHVDFVEEAGCLEAAMPAIIGGALYA